MNKLEIFKTNHWVVSHRSDSRYPGYLILSSYEEANDIYKLSSEALRELGDVLSKAEKLLISVYLPYKVILAKLGFSIGLSCHFHILPIGNLLLAEINNHPRYTNEEPDGKDALLFVSREYCEQPLSNDQQAALLQEVMRLKEKYNYLIDTQSLSF